jgi:type IV pilus assembly protein PilB
MQEQTRRTATQALISAGIIPSADAADARGQDVGRQVDASSTPSPAPSGPETVDLSDVVIPSGALELLDPAQARRRFALPIGFTTGGALRVAVPSEQANDLLLADDLRRITKHPITFVVAPPADIIAKINLVYRSEDLADLAGEAAPEEDADTDDDARDDEQNDSPAIKYVKTLIKQAINDRATDIHIETGKTRTRVRFDIDGVLRVRDPLPGHLRLRVVSVLKLMSDMEIDKYRVGQDGRFDFDFDGEKIDIRAVTIPTVTGEQITLRILHSADINLDLRGLGFSEKNYTLYREQFTQPNGLILVTGPTGHGKSTTLKETTKEISHDGNKVITVEDPVEYEIDGVSQMQINKKAGLTYDTALLSILRAHPHILVLGEIRDRETADMALEFANTGHLVLSTLHTNDAPSAVTRLLKWGCDPFSVGTTLLSVVAQRLCRRLCERCKVPVTVTPEQARLLGLPLHVDGQVSTVYGPKGCNHCLLSGYKGLVGLQEVMAMNEEIEELVTDAASSTLVRRAAVRDGMTTMREDGMQKVLAGLTSIEEITRVTRTRRPAPQQSAADAA